MILWWCLINFHSFKYNQTCLFLLSISCLTRRQSGTWWYYQTRSKVALCVCRSYSTKDYLYHKEGMLLFLSSILLDLFVFFCLLAENHVFKRIKVVATELCFAPNFSSISSNIFGNISIICTRQKFLMPEMNRSIQCRH